MNKLVFCLICLVLLGMLLIACGTSTTPQPSPTGKVTPAPFVEPSPSPLPTSPSITDEPPTRFAHLGTPWSDFSLQFNPDQWDIISFNNELVELDALEHRSLTGCRITPNIPVGLGNEWTSDDGRIDLTERQLYVKRFFQSGELKFVVYFGFIAQPYEGAVEVHFTIDPTACLQAAEALFAATEVVLPGLEQPPAILPVIHNSPGSVY